MCIFKLKFELSAPIAASSENAKSDVAQAITAIAQRHFLNDFSLDTFNVLPTKLLELFDKFVVQADIGAIIGFFSKFA